MSGIQQALLAAGGDRLRLDSTTYSHDNPGGSSASFRIDADGFVYGTVGGALVAQCAWVTPPVNAANYDVRWSTTSGTVDSTPGAENTNLNLGTDRTWNENSASSLETCTFQARIHRAGDAATPLATANITLEVDGSP
jgi:hypothetical protein